jgi:hypothetical protein
VALVEEVAQGHHAYPVAHGAQFVSPTLAEVAT